MGRNFLPGLSRFIGNGRAKACGRLVARFANALDLPVFFCKAGLNKGVFLQGLHFPQLGGKGSDFRGLPGSGGGLFSRRSFGRRAAGGNIVLRHCLPARAGKSSFHRLCHPEHNGTSGRDKGHDAIVLYRVIRAISQQALLAFHVHNLAGHAGWRAVWESYGPGAGCAV